MDELANALINATTKEEAVSLLDGRTRRELMTLASTLQTVPRNGKISEIKEGIIRGTIVSKLRTHAIRGYTSMNQEIQLD